MQFVANDRFGGTLPSLCLGLVLALAPLPATALPSLSEVFYDAAGSDNGLGFVELYGEPGASLDGLFLEGINGANGSAGPTIALSGVFPGDGIAIFFHREKSPLASCQLVRR